MFLFAAERDVQRNPTPSNKPLTSTNDVRLHTRRLRPSHGEAQRGSRSSFVLVRALHTRRGE